VVVAVNVVVIVELAVVDVALVIESAWQQGRETRRINFQSISWKPIKQNVASCSSF
jgi:hypothetical protein